MMDQDEWTDSEDEKTKEKERIQAAYHALSSNDQDIIGIALDDGMVDTIDVSHALAWPNEREKAQVFHARTMLHRLEARGILIRANRELYLYPDPADPNNSLSTIMRATWTLDPAWESAISELGFLPAHESHADD